MNRGWVVGLAGAVTILAAVGMTAWGHYLVDTYWIYNTVWCGNEPFGYFNESVKEGRALYDQGEVLETVGPWLLGAGCVVMAIGLWMVLRPMVAEWKSEPT